MSIHDMKIFLNKMEIVIPSTSCCCPCGWLLQIWWSQIMVEQLWVVTSDTNTGLVLTELKGTAGPRRSLFLSNMISDGCWEAVYGWNGSQNNSAASAKLCWRFKVTFGLWEPKIYSARMNINLSLRSLSSVLSLQLTVLSLSPASHLQPCYPPSPLHLFINIDWEQSRASHWEDLTLGRLPPTSCTRFWVGGLRSDFSIYHM